MSRYGLKSVLSVAAGVLLSAGSCVAAHADPILTLIPSGTVYGAVGSPVSWTYTVNNDTGYYLLVDNSYFCQSAQDPQFGTCTQTLGSYSDAVANDFTVIDPFTSTVESLDGQSVFGSYAISPTASVGQVDAGNLIATDMEYSQDPYSPSFDPTSQVSGDVEISAAASVTVAPATAATPEPSSLALMLTGGFSLIYVLRRRPLSV